MSQTSWFIKVCVHKSWHSPVAVDESIPVYIEQAFRCCLNYGILAKGFAYAAFGQRRKTLRNTLKAFLTEAEFAQLGIDSQLRAENLGVAEFARIAQHCDNK